MLSRFGDWQRRGRFWHNLITGRIIPVIAGGALPATDAFTDGAGADENITVYSANWTANSGTIYVNVTSDDVYPNTGGGGGETGVHWNADTFANDQYAQALCNSMTSSLGGIGPGVRMHASTHNYYSFYSDNAGSYLGKDVAGTWTQLGSTGAVFVATSTYRLEASGTTITPKKDGVTTGIGAQTDSAHSTGYAGLTGFNGSATTNRMDNWEGGDLSAAATVYHNLALLGVGG